MVLVRGKNFTPNGCGPKSKWPFAKVPQFVFRGDCNRHDLAYALGGTEADRERADKIFHAAMLRSARMAPWHLRDYYSVQAHYYYLAVRVGGKAFFYYE